MTEVGNDGAAKVYGCAKVPRIASKEEKQQFVIDKYEKRAFAPKSSCIPVERNCESQAPSETSRTESQSVSDFPVVRKASISEQRQIGRPDRPGEQPTKTGSAAQAVHITDAFFDDFFNELEDSQFQSKAVASLGDVEPSRVTPSLGGCDLDVFLNSTLSVAGPRQPDTNTEYAFDLEWPA
jgi:hypothetical protein